MKGRTLFFFLSILTVEAIFRELKKTGCVDMLENVHVWRNGSIVASDGSSWYNLENLEVHRHLLTGAENIGLLPFWVAINQLSRLESGLNDLH